MKKAPVSFRAVAYAVSTALVAIVFTFAGVSDLLHAAPVMASLSNLGLPPYIADVVGAWKLLGVLALCAPGLPRLKEWAYAGFFFDMTGAALSHAFVSDPFANVVIPLVFLTLVLTSWSTRPDGRKLHAHPAAPTDAEARATVLAATSSSLALMAAVSSGYDTQAPRPAPEPAPRAAIAPSAYVVPGEVVRFWQNAGPAMWFAKNPEFDRTFRERFLREHEAAARGDLDAWRRTPEGSLALLILLDQYPRNAFRGTVRMYATDELARAIATEAVRAAHDKEMPPALRLFFYLPFGHSEQITDQERCVALSRLLGEPHLSHAKGHYDIIRRFGRFPHRNPILGRTMRPEEQAFLDAGGFSG